MGEQLRIGFLGAGLIATYHSKSLRRSESPVRRMGVYDPDPRRAAAFSEASGHTVMTSEDDVLDSCDAVYICTWTSEHLRQVEKAAARRLAIFCEKPLAFNVTTAEQMATMVSEARVVNLARPSLRRVEILCARRHIVIEGDDWYGPVSWTDANGDTGTLTGDELSTAVDLLPIGLENPDREFVRAALARTSATPDFADAVKAHRIVDAIYASAVAGGASVEVGGG